MKHSTSTCEQTEGRVSSLAAGHLLPEESDAALEHLEECKACQSRFQDLAAICSRLVEAKTELAPEAFERITHSLQSPPTLTANRRQDRNAARVAVLAACLLLILGSLYAFRSWQKLDGNNENLVENVPETPHQASAESLEDAQPSLLEMQLAAIEAEESLEASLKLIPVRVTNP